MYLYFYSTLSLLFMKGQAMQLTKHLGGKRETLTSPFRWRDSQVEFDYANWHPGEPSGEGEFMGMFGIQYGVGFGFSWDDYHCLGVLPSLCEIVINP